MIVPHAKSSAGMRRIYLPEKARRYFEQIRELNIKSGYPCGDKDLVFQRKQGMCNQRVFDAHLKKYCRGRKAQEELEKILERSLSS